MNWHLVLYIVCLVAGSAVSAAETALFALNRQALHRFRASGHRFQRLAHQLMQHPGRVLRTILISNTAFNVAMFAVSFAAFGGDSDPSTLGALAAGVTTLALVILFSEILPKAVALSLAEAAAPLAAPLVLLLQTVLAPVQWVLGTLLVTPLTRLINPGSPPPAALDTEELRVLLHHSALEGVISTRENAMLGAVVALPDMTVREIMVPRVDMETVSLGAGRDSIVAALLQSHHRKLPVCGRDPDDIIGLLYTRDVLLHPGKPVRGLVRPVQLVPEQANVSQLMRHFRRTHSQLAIVVDEYGGTAGLVSVEDVLEQIVGDISLSDQPAEAPPVEEIDENTYRLAGDLDVHSWKRQFSPGDIDAGIDTLAGLILSRLGRIPREGDIVTIRNLTLRVERVRRRRIESVLLTRRGHEAAPATAGAEGP